LLELVACPFHDPLELDHELCVDWVVGRAEDLKSPLAGREKDQEDIPLLNPAGDEHPLAGQQPSETSSTFVVVS
jgi:hypothetical protein